MNDKPYACTDAERIAVTLLGWKRVPIENSPDARLYRAANYGQQYESPGHTGPRSAIFNHSTGRMEGGMPDFTTLDGCRLFENAPAEGVGHFTGSGALQRYIHFLQEGTAEHSHIAALRATPEHRVAACLRVIREAGLCPPQ